MTSSINNTTPSDAWQLSFADALAVPTGPTLAQAREETMRAAEGTGVRCPCCDQYARVYRRTIAASSAYTLLHLYRAHGTAWTHLQHFMESNDLRRADEAKLAYWGLLQERTTGDKNAAGGPRAGYWRVTELGTRWVRGEATVPYYARVYDGVCDGLYGDPVGIREALGTHFDYDDLMACAADDVRRGAA